jgi:hypothetical protein
MIHEVGCGTQDPTQWVFSLAVSNRPTENRLTINPGGSMFQDTRAITRRDAIKGLSGAGVTFAALMVGPMIGVAQRIPYEVGYGLYGMRDLGILNLRRKLAV